MTTTNTINAGLETITRTVAKAAEQAAATAAGFATPPPMHAAGASIVSIDDSDGGWAKARRKFDALPSFREAATEVIDVVASEGRRDLPVTLSALAMDTDGKTVRNTDKPGRGGAPVEARAFSQLCARAGVGCGSRYLAGIEPARRASNLNIDLAASDNEATMRVRRVNDTWQTFAIVGKRYGAFDVDRLLATVLDSLDGSPRGDVVYDAERCSVSADVLWQRDHVVALERGDIFKTGIRLRTNDASAGAIHLDGLVFRPACLNMDVVSTETVSLFSRRHVGEMAGVAADIREAIAVARANVERFLVAWGQATEVKIDDTGAEIERVANKLIASLKMPKTSAGMLPEAMALAFSREPGNTAADVSNAITRAAHESAFPQAVRDDLEAAGARYIREAVAA